MGKIIYFNLPREQVDWPAKPEAKGAGGFSGVGRQNERILWADVVFAFTQTMHSIPGWVTNGLLFFAALYTHVQAARLSLPVYFWSFDRNGKRGREILSVCSKDTSPALFARQATAWFCLTRLMRAQDLTSQEQTYKADFNRRVLYVFVAFGLTLIAQFKPDAPAVLMPLSQALLLAAIGMIIGSLARYRILKTMQAAEAMLREQGLLKDQA